MKQEANTKRRWCDCEESWLIKQQSWTIFHSIKNDSRGSCNIKMKDMAKHFRNSTHHGWYILWGFQNTSSVFFSEGSHIWSSWKWEAPKDSGADETLVSTLSLWLGSHSCIDTHLRFNPVEMVYLSHITKQTCDWTQEENRPRDRNK